jgi:hypothetical protein
VIVTSRFSLSDLKPWQKKEGYVELAVDRLERGAARALLLACGVHGGDDDLDRVGEEFGWHALTLSLVGGLLGRFYDGDPSRSSELPPLERIVKRFPDAEPEAGKLARVLARYEELLTPEEVAVLKAVAAFRSPVTAQDIAGTFGATCLDDFRGDRVLLCDPGQIQLTLRLLSGMRLLEERPGAPPTYTSHAAIAQYFYSALLADTLLQEGVDRYLAEELERNNYRLVSSAGRPVRTRGVSVRSSPDSSRLPREKKVLDLLEELIRNAATRGNLDEAFAMYQDNLGGYAHLGAALGEHSRGLEIAGLFLDAPSPRVRDESRADHERYRRALGLAV